MKRTLTFVFSVFVFTLFFNGNVFGQVPGYLGKKVTIGYRMLAFPARTSVGNWNNAVARKIHFNTRHRGEVDYVVGKRVSVAGHFDYFRTGTSYNDSRIEGGYGLIRISGYVTGVQVRMYPFLRKGSLAPLGSYFHIGLAGYSALSEDMDSTLFASPDSTILGRNSGVNFNFGYTRNHLIGNSAMLSYGIEFGLPSTLTTSFPLKDPVDGLPNRKLGDISDRILGHSWIAFHLGVGGIFF